MDPIRDICFRRFPSGDMYLPWLLIVLEGGCLWSFFNTIQNLRKDYKQTPKGCNSLFRLFWRVIYPPKGICESRYPVWGPIVFTYILFIPWSRSRKGTWKADFPRGNKNAKMFYCVDGWVVIFYPFRFSSFSSKIRSKVSCFQKHA